MTVKKFTVIFLYKGENFFLEKIIHILRCYRIKLVIYFNAYTLLASFLHHAKCTAKFYFVIKIVFFYKILKMLHHLSGTFDMTGRAEANCNFYHTNIPFSIQSPQRQPTKAKILFPLYCLSLIAMPQQ